jgi:hypothetical protein
MVPVGDMSRNLLIPHVGNTRTSNAPLQPLPFSTALPMKLACRASVERMTAATVRYCLLVINWAAPAYAETPVPSRARESATNDFGSLKPLQRVTFCELVLGPSTTRSDVQVICARLGCVAAQHILECLDVDLLVGCDLGDATPGECR